LFASGIALTSAGEIVVSDWFNNRIRFFWYYFADISLVESIPTGQGDSKTILRHTQIWALTKTRLFHISRISAFGFRD
jgi:hypothetical protein